MLRRALLVPALVGFVHSQPVANSDSYAPVATADALPIDDLRDVEVPTYTETPGLASAIVFYATETAIAAVQADVTQDPLSQFPAATDVPINAAGEDSSSNNKRGLAVRDACDAQPTIANFYNVNVDDASAFQADPTISSVALAAPTPAGYFNNFQNAPGANSAYAYLGYAVVNSGQTGYDVNWCANQCTSINGCLSFNIYFERDPILEPGAGCENPAAFANIKCSFWGTALDSSTANNLGQWRSNFQVVIAGSNAYTSSTLGGPVTGYNNPPQSLNSSTMNAPLRDCAHTWTYLGYKLLQSGPYNPSLCGAACDAQTAYNAAYPSSSSSSTSDDDDDDSEEPVKCAAFGSYLLSMTNATSTYQLGQMCTLYTSDWDAEAYAVNTLAYDDAVGAMYTYGYSFFYAKEELQPVCQS